MENINTKNKTIVRLLILLLCAMIIPVSLIAQDIRTGVKGGVNVSNLFVDGANDESARTGFHLGAFAQFPVLDDFAIQPEILFNTKGARATYDSPMFDGQIKYNLSYIDVPVLAVFKLGESANIHVGPYVGFLLSSNAVTDGTYGTDATETIERSDLNTVDFGLAAGFALDFEIFSIGTRYNLGLPRVNSSELADTFIGETRNSLGQVYIALSLQR